VGGEEADLSTTVEEIDLQQEDEERYGEAPEWACHETDG